MLLPSSVRAKQAYGEITGEGFFPITLPVSPRVACPCFIKDLHLFIGHHRPYQERGRSGRDGERKTTLQREEDGEVLSTSLPNNTTLPPPADASASWLLLAPRHLAPFFNFLSLSLFCLLISLLKVFRRLPSASISTHLCLSAIITFQPSITPQPALINKHSESTPQHRTGLKMSPLCLCQYLSLC